MKGAYPVAVLNAFLVFVNLYQLYRLKKDRNINFLDYYQAYIDSYTKKDLRMIKIALNRFKDFLKEYYPLYEFSIKPDLITKEMSSIVGKFYKIPHKIKIIFCKSRKKSIKFASFKDEKNPFTFRYTLLYR